MSSRIETKKDRIDHQIVMRDIEDGLYNYTRLRQDGKGQVAKAAVKNRVIVIIVSELHKKIYVFGEGVDTGGMSIGKSG